ncbi:hypothetical protein Ntsu_33960 [Nocardia sp. IFM 10818]
MWNSVPSSRRSDIHSALAAISGRWPPPDSSRPAGAADFGWTAYTPLSDIIHSPGVGADMWILGVGVSGLGTILGAVDMLTTVVCLRCPGMTMFRMPIFTWNVVVASYLILLAFPLLTAAALALYYDRHLGGHIYDPASGGVMLFQHRFWFLGHPEVYVIALPFFGIVSEIFPVFSRKPIHSGVPQVMVRIGMAPRDADPVPRTPRRPLADILTITAPVSFAIKRCDFEPYLGAGGATHPGGKQDSCVEKWEDPTGAARSPVTPIRSSKPCPSCGCASCSSRSRTASSRSSTLATAWTAWSKPCSPSPPD